MSRDAIPPGPRPGMPVPAHLPVDWRDWKSLRNDVADNTIAIRRLERDVATSLKISRAIFAELTGNDAARIPGVDRDWGRTLRMVAAGAALIVACFLAACAGARVGTPAPQEHHQ